MNIKIVQLVGIVIMRAVSAVASDLTIKLAVVSTIVFIIIPAPLSYALIF